VQTEYKFRRRKMSDNLKYNNTFPQQIQMMNALEKIGQIKQLKIQSADFDTLNVVVIFDTISEKKKLNKDYEPTYEDMIGSINFCRIADNFLVKKADFITGELTIQWVETAEEKVIFQHLTHNEINLLKRHQKIECIKSIRNRLNIGLADAKNLMDTAYTHMVNTGLITNV